MFNELPEVGIPERPVVVVSFDERHLLFATAPSALIQRVEQVIRLSWSKSFGVYFAMRTPKGTLAQLSNRTQLAAIRLTVL